MQTDRDFYGNTLTTRRGSSSKAYVIPVSLACNADCLFCSAKTYGFARLPALMPSGGSVLDQPLDHLGDLGVRRFEITGGGEPTLHPQLPVIIERIRRQFGNDCSIKIYTNGLVLARIGPVEEVNISRTHWQEQVADKHMRFKIAPHQIKCVAEHYRRQGVKQIRLSVPMIRGAIDCAGALSRLMEETSKYVDRYVVRPLYPDAPAADLGNVDFSFDHPRVEVDRDACCVSNDKIIWAADHKFYSSWQLEKPLCKAC